MLIGSSNSLTYIKPMNMWCEFFHRLLRYQEEDCINQYKYCGIRFFDFKLSVGKHGEINAKSGSVVYPVYNMYEILSFFDSCGDVTIRITLEKTFSEHMGIYHASIDDKFKSFCNSLEVIYEHIKFCGGYRRVDGVRLFTFASEDKDNPLYIIDVNEHSWWYRTATRLFPFMRKRLNQKYIEKFERHSGYLLLNYVGDR
jgi:hypothetical protein